MKQDKIEKYREEFLALLPGLIEFRIKTNEYGSYDSSTTRAVWTAYVAGRMKSEVNQEKLEECIDSCINISAILTSSFAFDFLRFDTDRIKTFLGTLRN